MNVEIAPDAMRRMTYTEEVAYAQGEQDAEEGKPMECPLQGYEERIAYERGYTNHAGAVHG